MTPQRRWLSVALTLIACCALALYILFQARLMLIGPRIVLDTPALAQPLASSTLILRGRALNTTALYLNDRQITTDRAGNFEETLLFPLGYTEVRMSAEDRFGTRRAYTYPITRIE